MAVRNMQYRADAQLDDGAVPTPQRKILTQAISAALVAGAASGPLPAQELELEEIIVTATKRAESLMDVPLAIRALSGG